MGNGHEQVAASAARLADELPLDTARIVARLIETSPDLPTAEGRLAALPHHHYRERAARFLAGCGRVEPLPSPQAVALALLTAAHCEHVHRSEQTVELVWTGPDASAIPLRRTEQAILQVLDSARHRITLVSYAVYKIQRVRDALVRAARRGVSINVIVETPDRVNGAQEYSTIKAMGDDVASCATVYFWPKERRPQSAGGKLAILHVKAAVADGRWLFLSSANLTEYAFDINMELGLLVTGGMLPGHVEVNFDRLITMGVLQRV